MSKNFEKLVLIGKNYKVINRPSEFDKKHYNNNSTPIASSDGNVKVSFSIPVPWQTSE